MPNLPALRLARQIMLEVEQQSKAFDMEDWFEDPSRPMLCGTTACFGGWLARDPRFPGLTPEDLEIRGSFAVAEALGLEFEEAIELTWPEEYQAKKPRPRDVIEKLERLITVAEAAEASREIGNISSTQN